MRRKLPAFLAAILLAFLLSCSKNQTAQTGPHATVWLQDGTAYSGTVTNSSPNQITVAGDDKSTRTFDMKQVRSVEYGEPPAQAAQAEPQSPPQTTPEGAPAPAPGSPQTAPAAPRRPEVSRTEPRYHPQEPTASTRTFELPVGTQISVRTDETIDSGKAAEGQTYAAEIYKDVLDRSGNVVVPHGSNAQIVIRSASKGGKITGRSDLVLDLQSASIDGRLYQLSTANMVQSSSEGVGKNKRTGKFVGGGAIVGTIIGALAGHGKGAAIGAASGAVAGGATQVLTRGGTIRVPAETILTFRLDRPLEVRAARE